VYNKYNKISSLLIKLLAMKKIIAIPFLLIGIFLSIFSTVAAADPSVVINEIAWMGTLISTDDEWLELKNNTGQSIDLTGWHLTAADGAPDIELVGVIPAQGYFLLERTDDDSVAAITANQLYTGALSNSGESLSLYDGEGNVVDGVFASGGWPAGDNSAKATMERINSLLPADSNNWQTGFTVGGTPAADNSRLGMPLSDEQPADEQPVDDIDENINDSQPADWSAGVSDIVINEFMPDPLVGQSEWIELYNNSDFSIDLSGWNIEDGKGKVLSLMGVIQPGQIMAFDLSASKLNNDGDLLIIKSNQGVLIDRVSYGNWADENIADNAPRAKTGETIARNLNGYDTNIDKNDFSLTIQATRGLSNIIILPLKEQTEAVEAEVIRPLGHQSATGQIIINELLPNPADDETAEFIELKNIDNKEVDITGWILQDNSRRQYVIDCDYYEDCLLAPLELLAIYRFQSGLALNNTGGDQVQLSSAEHQLMDEAVYQDKTEAGNSYSRTIDDHWQWTKRATPGRENIFVSIEENNLGAGKDNGFESTTTEIVVFLPIKINEILPNPVGSDMVGEFIELYNPNEQEVDLIDWQIDDDEGGSRPYQIKTGKIKAGGYLVLPRTETKLSLNNDFDAVRIFSPDGLLQDEIDYEGAKEGRSYSLSGGDWFWSERPTPQADNLIISAPAISGTRSGQSAKGLIDIELESIRELAVGDQVRTRGVVAVEPGVLGSQIFYLAGSGIQVYSYKKDFPQLAVGDYVEVIGEISEAGGERRIKTASAADIRVLDRQHQFESQSLDIAEVGESCEGFLVKLIGTVVEKNGNNLYLDDGTGEIRVYLNKNTGINPADIGEGESWSVTGIVSETKSGYRILPRQQSDLQLVGEVKGAAEEIAAHTNWSQLEKYFLALMIFLGVTNVWLMWHNWQLKKSGWRIIEEEK